ncbi:uncharacterized protein LOC134234867 [Saccostrea cucullata]|uniref:uncharacterized protein LOC134234867 n=1 Tax=Saccostrea cuccullata TaxID=36930 RepID=UPI002ED615E5
MSLIFDWREQTRDGCVGISAHVMKIPPQETSIEKQIVNSKSYKEMLQFGDMNLPDPLQLYENWQDEKFGMKNWPSLFITDLTAFLMRYETEERAKKHLNQYKVGKAYQYFQSQWLKEVFYHPIDRTSPYCFLRATCTPSKSLRSEPHTVWVCCVKDSGKVKSAFCTCTAGFGQTCNHVAGLLFRVEYANKMGCTSCTSNKCEWVVPKERPLKPAMLKDMTFERAKHGKTGKTRTLNGSRKNYNALPEDNEEDNFLATFSDALREILPDACLFKGLDVDQPHQAKGKEPHASGADMTVEDCSQINVQQYFMKSMLSSFEQNDTSIKIPPSTITCISNSTKGQSSNSTWHDMRIGRLTSSYFYSIHTKVGSINNKPTVVHDVKPLVKHIMGYTKVNPNIKSLKYGREMEPVAKGIYLKEFCTAHKNAKSDECGIVLDSVHTYIAASPDLLVSCSCCGDGCVEIKCPLITKCSSCLSFCTCKIPVYLINKSGELSLKSNHSYFAQIQGQMHVTGRKWCDFFVYTCNGTFTENIEYNETYFTDILKSLQYFFFSFVLPELKSYSIEKSLVEEAMEVDENANIIEGETYFCPCCNRVIVNNVTALKDRSICCDLCGLWYHFKCVNLTDAKLKKTPSWYCSECSM